MPGTIAQYFRLLLLIFKRGRLRHSDHDFNRIRSAALIRLNAFAPGDFNIAPARTGTGRSLFGRKTLQSFLSFGAIVKNGFRSRGGHLTDAALKLSYVRIPKSASTSLCYMMLQSLYPDLKKYTLSDTDVNFLADINLKKEIPPVPGIFFTVVRNPFARMVSVYRDFFENASGEFLYQDYMFGILKRHFTFREFLRHVFAIPDALRDQHLKTQAGFLKFYWERKIDVIVLKLEQRDEVNSFLSGYGLALPHLNAGGESYDYRSYYDEECIKLVTGIYSSDIKLFEYESEPGELLVFSRN